LWWLASLLPPARKREDHICFSASALWAVMVVAVAAVMKQAYGFAAVCITKSAGPSSSGGFGRVHTASVQETSWLCP